MVSSNALIALGAAVAWGGGDFSGGMGVKAAGGTTAGALRVVIAGHAMSLAVLLAIVAGAHAAMPRGTPLVWALAAGVSGGISLTAFYMALSRGAMGVSAAVSGLLAAAIPAVVSSLLEGRPDGLRLAGFVLAGCSIWVIAAGPSPENLDPSAADPTGGGLLDNTMLLAVVGGVGFGFYFVALRLANPLGVVEPMALARVGSLGTCLVLLLLVGRRSQLPPGSKIQDPWTGSAQAPAHPAFRLNRAAWGWAGGAALLDTGGNLLFVAATLRGRLDVAAVLASLYPASTILLAAWRLHERPTRRQVVGMSVALAAVVMITL